MRILLAALLLAGCAAPVDPATPAANVPPGASVVNADTVAACTAKGGTMQPEGLLATPWCVIAYKDAGKDCTTGSDCEGDCRIGEIADPGAGGKVHGSCQQNNVPYGCFAPDRRRQDRRRRHPLRRMTCLAALEICVD